MEKIVLEDVNISDGMGSFFNVSSGYINILKKYGIEKVRVRNSEIVGPAHGMIQILEETYKAFKFKYVADIFAGALGYSQVCSQLGAERIDAYDLQINNYYSKNRKLHIYQRDLLKMNGATFSKYDLIIVEPPKKYHLLFLNTLPNFLRQNALLLFRIGFVHDSEHIQDCIKICENKFGNRNLETLCLYEEAYIKIS